jgi:hypothetical protein
MFVIQRSSMQKMTTALIIIGIFAIGLAAFLGLFWWVTVQAFDAAHWDDGGCGNDKTD